MRFIALLKKIIVLKTLLWLLYGSVAMADNEVTVFDVRKTLKMTDNQKTFKDYYLNGGSEMGLKPGMVVTIKRRMSLYDGFQNKSLEELMVAVGKLKLIHVQKGVSVARLYSLISRKNTPVLDYDYIMLGDKVDLNSVYMDRGKSTKSSYYNQEVLRVEEPEVASVSATPQPAPKLESKDFSSSVPVATPN